jgi:hypothetical protein
VQHVAFPGAVAVRNQQLFSLSIKRRVQIEFQGTRFRSAEGVDRFLESGSVGHKGMEDLLS